MVLIKSGNLIYFINNKLGRLFEMVFKIFEKTFKINNKVFSLFFNSLKNTNKKIILRKITNFVLRISKTSHILDLSL